MSFHQNNIAQYVKAIQEQLTSIVSPIKVYSNFNRNFATEPQFVTFHLRNVHQPVYTGTIQSIKGIDRPIFQISIFTTETGNGFNIANTIIQSLHGYSGFFGTTNGFPISKADVNFLYHDYDDTVAKHGIHMDCTLDIPA
jgi:hypothetical protein